MVRHDESIPSRTSSHRSRGRRNARLRLIAEIAGPFLVAIAVHMINPLIVNTIGQQGPFATKIEYIPSQKLAYDRGRAMIDRAAREQQSHILNTRNTRQNPQQPAFFREIEEALKKSSIQYTRSIYYQTDPELANTRWFLEHLGMDPKFRLTVTVLSGELPSCVITDKEAIFGFNDNSGVLTRALYISGPQSLVDDFREVVRRVADNATYSVVVKDFGESVESGAIDQVVTSVQERMDKLLKAIRNLSES